MGLFDRLFGSASLPALPPPATKNVETRRDSTFNPLTGLGGSTDKGSVARPGLYRNPLNIGELCSLYENNGIARRIVDLLPSRATRKGWTAPGIGSDEEKRLGVWSKVQEAMAWSRLYGGSAMLMITDDDIPSDFSGDERDWLTQPLDLDRVGSLVAIHVFDAIEATPIRYDSDVRSPTFRQPLAWSIGADGWSGTVHASRVVHFRGNRLPSTRRGTTSAMLDASVLQVVWDEIRRLTETMQGGAVLAQELREGVLKVANLRSREVGDEARDLDARISLISRTKSLLGLVVLGEGDEYENRSNPPTGFKELSEGAVMMLATVLGWPRSMLTGEAPGGMSTDDASGMERERQLVSDYQETNRGQLEQLYSVVYAAQDGPTKGATPDDGGLEFAALDEPGEKETAELRKMVAETDALYIDRGVYGPDNIAASRFGAEGWSIEVDEVAIPDPEDDAAIDAARKALEGVEE